MPLEECPPRPPQWLSSAELRGPILRTLVLGMAWGLGCLGFIKGLGFRARNSISGFRGLGLIKKQPKHSQVKSKMTFKVGY